MKPRDRPIARINVLPQTSVRFAGLWQPIRRPSRGEPRMCACVEDALRRGTGMLQSVKIRSRGGGEDDEGKVETLIVSPDRVRARLDRHRGDAGAG
jgi:hypothetical protein